MEIDYIKQKNPDEPILWFKTIIAFRGPTLGKHGPSLPRLDPCMSLSLHSGNWSLPSHFYS